MLIKTKTNSVSIDSLSVVVDLVDLRCGHSVILNQQRWQVNLIISSWIQSLSFGSIQWTLFVKQIQKCASKALGNNKVDEKV